MIIISESLKIGLKKKQIVLTFMLLNRREIVMVLENTIHFVHISCDMRGISKEKHNDISGNTF
jgi:hypothetical protein